MAGEPGTYRPSTPQATAAVAQSRGGSPDAPADLSPPPAGAHVEFCTGKGIERAAQIVPYERQKGDPIYRPLRIYALDASASRLEGAVALVNVPYEQLEPGPVGALFEVSNRDGRRDVDYQKLDLDDPRVMIRSGLSPTPSEPRFHQQMVYAAASTVYAAFQRALGRDLTWGFDAREPGRPSRLLLRPYACDDRNAFYLKEDGEVCFGYYQSDEEPRGRNLPRGFVFTALSHDIVVHEVTHALLDGLRAHFTFPTNPDVLAFHEAFADIIALLQRFSYKDVVLTALRRCWGRVDQSELLLGLARQFGETTGSPGPLRKAFDPEGSVLRYNPAREPHELGEVLVRAVFDAFTTVFQRKTERYVRIATRRSTILAEEELSTDLQTVLVEEATQLASQFLSICIRAIDYCPPVDIEFGEFLRAVLTADYDLVPDDPWRYREAWIDAFARRGIYPKGVMTLSEESLLWCPPEIGLPHVPGLTFAELQFKGDPGRPADVDELRRQANVLGRFVAQPALLRYFGLAAPGGEVGKPCIESIRSSRRVGPDGQIVFDLVAEVTQKRTVRGSRGSFDVYGGATVILGPDAQIRYVIGKGVRNEEAADEQRSYIDGRGRPFWRRDQGRLVPEKQLFRFLHRHPGAGRS